MPPHRVDVLRRVGPVRGVEVDPIADPPRQLLEVLDVDLDGLTAQLDEPGDADLFFDRALAGDREAPLDLNLDREPVGVPPCPALDEPASHRLEAAEQVLVDPRPDVVQPRGPVGGGRSLIEDPRRGVGSLLNGALEDPIRSPMLEDLVLQRHEVGTLAYGAEHGLSCSSGRTSLVIGPRKSLGISRRTMRSCPTTRS